VAAKYSWLFVDGESQDTFRIRTGDPVWQENTEGLIRFIGSKGADIIEGVINRGVRGDQQILWESDGVSVG